MRFQRDLAFLRDYSIIVSYVPLPFSIQNLCSCCLLPTWRIWITHFSYRILPGKCPWALAAQAPKMRVASYTKQMLECSNYLHASAHPGWEVRCQGVPNRPASSLRPCFVEASPTVENVTVRVPTENPKVLWFQICCTRTKYLSEMHKKQTVNSWCHRAIFSQFVLYLKGLSAKNWAQFGSSDFWSFAMKLVVLMYLVQKCPVS